MIWAYVGLMMFGMALMKSGVLGGERDDAWYLRPCAGGLSVGIMLTSATYFAAVAADGLAAMMAWAALAPVVGLPTSLGYLAGITLLAKRGSLQRVTHALSCVGRMAVTNYLLQSALAVLVFYGHGLGLYGRLGMGHLLLVLAGILTANIAGSVLWLRYFRFGPVEWLWRWATYRSRPPLR